MYLSRTRKTKGERWRLLAGLLCCLLLILGVTLSVSHGHEQGVAHADCGLCAAAHGNVQLTAAPVLLTGVQVFARVPGYVAATRTRTLARSALFTRPPPAASFLNL